MREKERLIETERERENKQLERRASWFIKFTTI
jgi:hypothetical protein